MCPAPSARHRGYEPEALGENSKVNGSDVTGLPAEAGGRVAAATAEAIAAVPRGLLRVCIGRLLRLFVGQHCLMPSMLASEVAGEHRPPDSDQVQIALDPMGLPRAPGSAVGNTGPMRPVDGAPAIWGRAVESERLGDVIRDAAGGRPGAVFVRGEAGVGKTVLVRSVTDEARRTGV